MKKILFIAVMMAFVSCKKCYQCTTNVKGIRWDSTIFGESNTQTNFCGTPYEKNKHEKESSSTKPSTNNSTIVTKMTCIAE